MPGGREQSLALAELVLPHFGTNASLSFQGVRWWLNAIPRSGTLHVLDGEIAHWKRLTDPDYAIYVNTK